MLTDKEKDILYQLMLDDKEAGYRAKIILFKADGYTVPEIGRATNLHDVNIRKWLHRFNEKGLDGIVSKIHKHKPIKITNDIEKKIVEIMTKNPRENYGLPFSTWSLRVLAGFITKEINLIESISHTEIRNIILKHGVKWRNSKITLGSS
ncbi:MAG TPA: helix-turn-helix domain-containing protein [Candidatus Nitrosocosmicus sp.]